MIVKLHRDGDPPEAKAQGTQKRIRSLVTDFVKNWVAGTYFSIETDSVPEAKRWTWFLDRMGLVDGAVITHSVTTDKEDIPSANAQRAYWMKSLNHNAITDVRSTTPYGTRGLVRIDVDLRKLTDGDASHTKVTVLYGVRFVLARLAVIGVQELV